MYSKYRMEVGQEDIIVEVLQEGLNIPKFLTPKSAGLQIYSPFDFTVVPKIFKYVPLKIKVKFPPFVIGKIENDISVIDNGIYIVGNSINEDSTSELKILIGNYTDNEISIKKNDVLGLLVLQPTVRATVRN